MDLVGEGTGPSVLIFLMWPHRMHLSLLVFFFFFFHCLSFLIGLLSSVWNWFVSAVGPGAQTLKAQWCLVEQDVPFHSGHTSLGD